MKVFKKIYEIVRQIPKGKVTTYGWVAVRLGNSGTVRVVGNALHQNPDPKNIPCHRIVDRTGRLAANYACPPSAAPKGASRRGFGGWGVKSAKRTTPLARESPKATFTGWREQKRKLLAEGVKFKGKTCVDLEKYLVKL